MPNFLSMYSMVANNDGEHEVHIMITHNISKHSDAARSASA